MNFLSHLLGKNLFRRKQETFKKLMEKISDKVLLTSEGLFVLEHGEQLDFSGEPFFVKQRKYGG